MNNKDTNLKEKWGLLLSLLSSKKGVEKVMEEIYRTKSGLNVIYRGQYDHYLLVSDKAQSCSPIICMFDGGLSCVRNGEQKSVADWLIEYIQEYGPFYRCSGRFCKTRKKERLEVVLYKIYHGLDYTKQDKDSSILLGFRNPITIDAISDSAETDLINTGYLYDLGVNNIRSETYGINYTKHSAVFLGNSGIVIQCDDRRYYTRYEPNLYKIIKTFKSWHIGTGHALKSHIKGKIVPFAEIVWLYHNGLISTENAAESILSAHADIRAKNLRSRNNYSHSILVGNCGLMEQF